MGIVEAEWTKVLIPCGASVKSIVCIVIILNALVYNDKLTIFIDFESVLSKAITVLINDISVVGGSLAVVIVFLVIFVLDFSFVSRAVNVTTTLVVGVYKAIKDR